VAQQGVSFLAPNVIDALVPRSRIWGGHVPIARLPSGATSQPRVDSLVMMPTPRTTRGGGAGGITSSTSPVGRFTHDRPPWNQAQTREPDTLPHSVFCTTGNAVTFAVATSMQCQACSSCTTRNRPSPENPALSVFSLGGSEACRIRPSSAAVLPATGPRLRAGGRAMASAPTAPPATERARPVRSPTAAWQLPDRWDEDAWEPVLARRAMLPEA
jgi:hypothetical protein